ncbi:WecB/TagA/CpsF family glycosyltransferase [Pseudonocardia pini]|uniref:WecB/TagA/CpsF family glycosyltransferase n=1 Tax=Pseudonocardia pini TaxID=2758030 RepID=UPI0015EFE1BB|nr:WecB/TagA/CpsF family glycosyltransferase [Pseudonocardia pini]
MTAPPHTLCAAHHVRIAGIEVCSVTEAEVADLARRAWAQGSGCQVVTANTDILRHAARDPAAKALVDRATAVVADGMPLIWASRILGDPLPERVTGSSLIFSLSEAAAAEGRTVYVLGGAPGVPEKAAERLRERCPGLQVAGTDSPPFGFDADPAAVAAVVERVRASCADMVFVGMGFPRQEQLIERLVEAHPQAFYLGCGAAVPMAAGVVDRAPGLLQRSGLEWLYRLLREPGRLARRYLRNDLVFALGLMVSTSRIRVTTRGGSAAD